MKVITKDGLPLAWGYKVNASILGEQFPVSLRGWKENEYIILDHPVVKGEVVRIAPQTGCSLSYTVDGLFINMKTVILYSIVQPVRLMIIEFPSSFISYNLRKNNRQKTNFDCIFSGEKNASDVTHTGVIRDLSLSGALITHAKPLEKGEVIAINFKLPQGEISSLSAKVCNLRRNPKNAHHAFVTGVEFVNLNPEQDMVLRGFVESRVTERRGSERLTDGK